MADCSVDMQYSKTSLKISATMCNESKMEEVIYLKQAKQETVNTCNFAAVQPGDTFATFYLENSNINSLGECTIKSNKLNFVIKHAQKSKTIFQMKSIHLRGRPYMTSDDFCPFLTPLPPHQMFHL